MRPISATTAPNTFGHIAAACAAGDGDRDGLRQRPARRAQHDGARPRPCRGTRRQCRCGGRRRQLRSPASSAPREEVSSGKDTPSGHWEIAGRAGAVRLGLFSRHGPDLSGRPDRGDHPRRQACPASSATATPPAPRSSRGSARSTSAPASRSATPRPIPSSRSPRTRRISGSSGSMTSARPCASWSIRSTSAASSPGRSSARPPATFERTANRRDFAVPPPEPTLLDRLVDARQQGDRHRQDRRHLRASAASREVRKARRQHGAVRRGARRDGRCRRRRSGVRQFRRFRHALRPSPRRCRLCRGARGLRPPAARGAWPGCGRAICCSSPPTMAAIRPGAAPTTRASACPVLGTGPGLQGGDVGLRAHLRRHRRDRRRASRAARPAATAPPSTRRSPAMPELPEVETVRRGLQPVLEGARIVAVETRRPDLRFPFPRAISPRRLDRHDASPRSAGAPNI